MIGPALLRTTLALGLLALVTSCAELDTPMTTGPAPAPTPPQGYWNGDGVAGSPKIIVSIADQRAYFYKGKQLVGESTVSTGKPGFGTPPGYYTVFWKHADHVSSVFGDYVDGMGNVTKSNIDVRKDSKPPGSHYDGARMPFAMFFRGGYAMHQGYVPPYAASHGCIRLPKGMAETFFNAAAPGTPVIVKQEAVMRSVRPPAVDVVPPPVPYPVRYTSPAPVRTAPLRAPVPTPAPIPVRSPGPSYYRSPVPMQSPAPASLRSTPPTVLRSPAPVVPSRAPATVQSPAPLRSPTPAPLRPPTSTISRKPVPVPSPTPNPVRSRGPVRPPAPSPTPTPTPRRR